jgi:DNA repair protein RecO (recombination protein O)
MAEWSDRAIVLGLSRFGETGAILDVFARDQGRRRGLVYGGASRSKRAIMQPGNTLSVTWKARTQEKLGFFALAEPEAERTAAMMADAAALSAASAIADLMLSSLPEGEPKPGLFDAAETLLDALGQGDVWPAVYVRWELGLLGVLGYGLDFNRCAISGSNDGLTHVSPRTGRAVKGSEAGEFLDRLLVLPGFLTDARAVPTPKDVFDGLKLTGHFLANRLFSDLNLPLPEARYLMIDRLERQGRVSSS